MIEFIQHPLVLIGFKAFALLMFAFLLITLIGKEKSTAAHRSLVWVATMVALILVPLLSKTLPTWHLGIIPDSAPVTYASPPLKDSPVLGNTTVNGGQFTNDGRTASTEANPATLTAVPMQHSQGSAERSPQLSTINWIVIVWLTGLIGIMTTTLLGWLSLIRLQHQARDCFDEDLISDLEKVRKELGIRRSIRLLMSNRREIPMTWGIFHPVLHLPVSARAWNAPERRAVLIHELAHISRFDSAIQLLAQFVAALYWYNPLVWIANRRLRAEQESSCDDTVIRSGTSAPIYAQHLASIVSGRSVFPCEAAAALAAGRQGKLETRIHDILSSDRKRNTPSSRLARLTLAVSGCIALTLGTLNPFTSTLLAAEQGATNKTASASDLNDLDSLQDAIITRSLNTVDRTKMTRATIEGMLESLNDPHAKYLPSDELASMQFQLEGVLFGIGAQLRMDEDRLLVVRPIPGSPALDAGIQASDVIIAVDGKATKGQSLVDIVNQIRGPLDTKVQLRLEREGEERALTVTRGRIKLPTVYGLRGVVTKEGESEPGLIGKQNNIGYMQISYFGKGTAEELNDQISALESKGMKGAIIDLRFCPGGSLEPATQTADLFLAQGHIVKIQGRDGEQKVITATQNTHWKFPLVLLVNEATASAAEILCGALQDHDRAIILGTRTFGKASVQSLLHINEQLGAIKLTTAQYFPPKGKNIDRTPTSRSWGIDSTEGFFVPGNDSEAALKDRLQGTRPIGQAPLSIEQLTSEGVSESLDDPQLIAALTAIESRVNSGTFNKVGGSRTSLASYVRQQELKSQHSTLINKLNEIQSAVGNLVEGEK